MLEILQDEDNFSFKELKQSAKKKFVQKALYVAKTLCSIPGVPEEISNSILSEFEITTEIAEQIPAIWEMEVVKNTWKGHFSRDEYSTVEFLAENMMRVVKEEY